jgi:hypothetical protein
VAGPYGRRYRMVDRYGHPGWVRQGRVSTNEGGAGERNQDATSAWRFGGRPHRGIINGRVDAEATEGWESIATAATRPEETEESRSQFVFWTALDRDGVGQILPVLSKERQRQCGASVSIAVAAERSAKWTLTGALRLPAWAPRGHTIKSTAQNNVGNGILFAQ